ncbi:MAG: lamin tail domain-containing protein [Chloroflexota bacterium]
MKKPFFLIFLIFLISCAELLQPQEETAVLIHAVLYDGFELANADEIVVLVNISADPVDLSGWQITDNETGTAVLPPETLLQPDEQIWLAKNGTAVSNRFHHVVDFELKDTHVLVNNLSGVWPTLSDEGDTLVLLNERDRVMDVVVYKDGVAPRAPRGWEGTAVQPSFEEEEGVFLVRTSHEDSNSAQDWVQEVLIESNGVQVGSPNFAEKPLTK